METEKIKKKLLLEKTSLENLIARVTTDEIVEADSWQVVNEIGDEQAENIALLSKQERLESLQLLLRRVGQALEDLANNRYGICNKCEENIPEDRLDVQPHAQYCLKCQKFVDNQKD